MLLAVAPTQVGLPVWPEQPLTIKRASWPNHQRNWDLEKKAAVLKETCAIGMFPN